jgi:hypothetical protein
MMGVVRIFRRLSLRVSNLAIKSYVGSAQRSWPASGTMDAVLSLLLQYKMPRRRQANTSSRRERCSGSLFNTAGMPESQSFLPPYSDAVRADSSRHNDTSQPE